MGRRAGEVSKGTSVDLMAKLAFISTMAGSPWGGSEELWSQAALRLRQQGHEIFINVKWWPELSRQVKQLQEAGCIVERSRAGEIVQRVARKIVYRSGLQIKSWLDKVKPNFVVISQGDPYSGTEWAEQCSTRQIPYALIAQAAGEHWWPDDSQAMRSAKSYEAATASYFVSNGNLQLVRTQLATPLSKARVVRNPFNVSYDANIPWPEDSDILRLACVGRLDPSAKGQDILFDVLRENKWRQRKLIVSLYGNGQNCGTLKKLKELYGLDSMLFAGFTPDVEEIWKTHHALILPSRYEGLPLALVETMLCGRPAIVSNVAGNTELVEDGVTGFVAAAPTALHLDEAMERAWTQRDHLKKMGQLAGERVRQLIPRDPIAAFCEELYQQIK